jgi:exodeoxyribonuclease VII small subunit
MAPRNNPGLNKDEGPEEPAATDIDIDIDIDTDIDTLTPATAADTAAAAADTAAAAATAPTANAPAAAAAAVELPAAKASRSRSKGQAKPGQSRSAQSRAKTDSRPDPPTSDLEIEQSIAADLNYSEARTALDLSLAQLQASDLDVESMAGLFRRAQSYAARCEALLLQVEQQVALWDSDNPEQAPQPYRPE